MKRRVAAVLCLLALCLGLAAPSAAVGEVCFTAVNDSVLPLTADTMPVWSGGMLYVPYSVFSSEHAGGTLGLNSVYSRSSGTVSIYALRNMLVFDLEAGTCYEQGTGDQYPNKAIIRNGRAYVPAARVCDFFGLSYTYNLTNYGYLVRIKNDKTDLSDSVFIDAAGNLMSSRLREYNQSIAVEREDPSTPSTIPVNPATQNPSRPADVPSTTEPEQVEPPAQEEPSQDEVNVCLAFRCETGQGASSIAGVLEQNGKVGLFFFPAEEVGAQGGLIRRLLGSGHSVGILARGETPDQTRELLQEGGRALEAVAHSRTYFALVPDGQRQALETEGWVCWEADVEAEAGGSAYGFAVRTVESLPAKGSASLLLDDSDATAQAMPYLMSQLRNGKYVVTIPRETGL